MDPVKRFTLRLKTPNPIFISWMEEWLNYATAKNLKTKRVFADALESLRKFPLTLNSGQDCMILDGFGTTLCKMIDKKIEAEKYKHTKLRKPISNESSSLKISPKKSKITKKSHGTQVTKPKTKSLSQKPSSRAPLNSETDSDESFMMSPNSFEIILLVDISETSGKTKRAVDTTISSLQFHNITHEVRKLSVGDFAWICRDKDSRELVLPYIVERKRIDDFAGSIKDGRFHEQKFRLKQSGVENLIYLIESYGNNQHTGLPIQNLLQAAVNTQVHNNFHVKFTDNHNDSILYLAVLTEILVKKFASKVLISCAKDDLKPIDEQSDFIPLMKFSEFNALSSKTKNLTAREIFIKQLLQLKLLSVDKVLAITEVYPTPRSLFIAYKKCNEKEGENLLANIKHGAIKRPIGPLISKTIYEFYNLKCF